MEAKLGAGRKGGRKASKRALGENKLEDVR